MALDLDKIRAAVKEQTGEQPALTEQDLEAEKTRLREEIKRREETGTIEEKTSDGLVSLEYIAHQNNISRLAELETGGMSAMRTDEEQGEYVIKQVESALIERYGKLPKYDENENRIE